MDQFFGRIVDVQRKTEGDMLAAAAAVDATTLTVYDTADFDETGGQLLLSGITYTYSGVDDATATITLATAVTVAAAVDDPVDVLDSELGGTVVEYVAHVLLDDQDPDDEPIEVTVQHALVPMLVEAVRGGASESVTLARDGDDDLMISQVDGKLAEELVADQAILDAAAAFDKATLALTETELAIAISDGRVNVYYQTAAPWAAGDATKDANLGDLWYDTDSGTIETRLVYRWMGQFNRNWVLVSDQSIVKALKDAQSAQTTADGKIVHFVSATAPVAEGYGDIWTNTAEDNKKYWWNGSAWAALLVGDAAIAATLTGKVIQTAFSGNRIRMRQDSAGGVIEGFTGDGSGETYPSLINPTIFGAGGTRRLALDLQTGRFSPGGTYIGYLRLFSGTSDGTSGPQATFSVDQVNVDGILSVAGRANVTGEVHGAAGFHDDGLNGGGLTGASIGNGGRIVRTTSSKRYKKNIRNAKVNVPGLRRLAAKVFRRKDEGKDGREYLGLIAEDVEAAGFDHLVFHDAEGRVEGVHFDALTVALLAGWQSQQDQIDALTARVTALEGP